jgi:hypothetical protein
MKVLLALWKLGIAAHCPIYPAMNSNFDKCESLIPLSRVILLPAIPSLSKTVAACP